MNSERDSNPVEIPCDRAPTGNSTQMLKNGVAIYFSNRLLAVICVNMNVIDYNRAACPLMKENDLC